MASIRRRYNAGRRSGASHGATSTRSPRAASNPHRKPSIGPCPARRSTKKAASGTTDRKAASISAFATETRSSCVRPTMTSATRRTIGTPPISSSDFGRPNRRDWPPARIKAVSTNKEWAPRLKKRFGSAAPGREPGQARNDKPWSHPRIVAAPGRQKGVRRVSPIPFGLGFTKPHNYREVLRSVWNNKRVTMRYLYYAKKLGRKVAVVNPVREPGLERYWVPSVPRSALFGTRFADEFFAVHTGGDIAFITGVLKHMLENNWIDEAFVEKHTTGFYALRVLLVSEPWEELERQSGVSRERMLDFARMYHEARTAVFVWSMGITHHRFGVDNVKAIVNLGLVRGIVGREKCGLMPIRGHSGVQGGSEMGAQPGAYGLGFPVDDDNADRFGKIWGFRPPTMAGMTAVGMIDAAHEGLLDVLYQAGGNFLETLPEPEYVREALGRIPLRIHQDLVLTTSMLVEPAEKVLLFPAQTRYEQRGGGTETSTERRVYFSPHIPRRRVGEARAEWEIFMNLAERAIPSATRLVHFKDAAAIRREIAQAIPTYDGIQNLASKGDAFQYGCRTRTSRRGGSCLARGAGSNSTR